MVKTGWDGSGGVGSVKEMEWSEIKTKIVRNQTMTDLLCYMKKLGLFPADDGMALE